MILQAGAVSYGKATSYLPVIDLLKNYFRIGDRDSPREIREKVTGRLLMLDAALEATLPALLALLDLSGEDRQWQILDPPQRRQRMLDGVKRLLLREAQVQPLLVVFEDLHWIDTETQALLDSLVESLAPARLLLFVNYRPEYEHHWGSKTSYTQLRLDPLPSESAFELLHSLLGADGTIEPLMPILIERTEGNPFFLEETVRALVETKALVGERGAYRLARVLTDIQVPPTVQAILAARIDRLSPEDKRLLQSAAVIGKDVPFALLAAIVEEREEELRRGLAHLQAAEFLYEVSLFPDLEYTFMHALTHEVAYGSVLHERRRDPPRKPRRGHRKTLHGIAWPSMWSGWPTTRCGAKRGRKRRGIAARPARRRRRGRRTARRWPPSSRRLTALKAAARPSDRQAHGHRPSTGDPILARWLLGELRACPRTSSDQAEPLAEGPGGRPGPPSRDRLRVVAHCLWATRQVRSQHTRAGESVPSSLPTRAGDLSGQLNVRLCPGRDPTFAWATTSRRSRTSWSTSRWNRTTRAGAKRRLGPAIPWVVRAPMARDVT